MLLAVLAAACQKADAVTTITANTGRVTVDGSSTVFLITAAIANEFRNRNANTNVTVGNSGTSGGFRKFCAGEKDISDASRPINAIEQQTCATNGIEFVELPVAYDGLAVLVNPKNDWANDITTAELRALWQPEAQGRVTTWNQVRAGWPDRAIHLYGPGGDSGTYDYFTEAVVGKERASRNDYTASEDDTVLVRGVANDPDALGYFGFAYYVENRDKLKVLAIDDRDPRNGDGPTVPSVETVTRGTYQPLARPLFIYVSVKALARPEVQAFASFYLEHAPKLISKVGYIALPAQAYPLAQRRLDARRGGSLFRSGESHLNVSIEELLAREKSNFDSAGPSPSGRKDMQ